MKEKWRTPANTPESNILARALGITEQSAGIVWRSGYQTGYTEGMQAVLEMVREVARANPAATVRNLLPPDEEARATIEAEDPT